MKKLILKIVLMATAVFAGFGYIPTIMANAEGTQESGVESVEIVETENEPSEEETSENQANFVEETETSEWFDETMKPALIQYGACVFGFATALFFMLKQMNKTGYTLGIALGALTQSNADNISTSQAVAELKAESQASYERQQAEYERRMQEMSDMFANALKELRESLADKVVDIDETAHKLLDVEMLAYGNNAKLVSNGTAKRIAEVVNNGKVKHEE